MNRAKQALIIISVLSGFAYALFPAVALAAEHPKSAAGKANDPSTDAADSNGDRVNVEAIKEKYWARGDETELGVVQNRLYSKASKFQFGTFIGVVATDPFLSVQDQGVNLGYNFNEYIGLHLVGWHDYTNASSALKTFRASHGNTDNNPPRWYYGTECTASLMYGKLSLLGKKIIHYDMHVLGGIGMTDTDNGTYITPSLGLGQQIYLTQSVSLRIDYRLMYYREHVLKRSVDPGAETYLSDLGPHSVWSNVITLGVNFFYGGQK